MITFKKIKQNFISYFYEYVVCNEFIADVASYQINTKKKAYKIRILVTTMVQNLHSQKTVEYVLKLVRWCIENLQICD